MPSELQTLKKNIKIRSLFTPAFGTIIGVGWITVMGSLLAQAGPMGAIIGFIGRGLILNEHDPVNETIDMQNTGGLDDQCR